MKSIRACGDYVSEMPPFKWFQGNEPFQILMLGPEGAGKTTLLYKLKIPGWKKADITRDMSNMKREQHGLGVDGGLGIKDPGYHYEEFRSDILRQYGIWDIPGNDAFMRLWPMFYRYVRISAIVFVVDNFSAERDKLERIVQAREMIQFLLNEDELRVCCFWLVLNVDWPTDNEPSASEKDHKAALYEMLGVLDITNEPAHRTRFFKATINCAETTSEHSTWEEILKAIRKVYFHIGEGAPGFGR